MISTTKVIDHRMLEISKRPGTFIATGEDAEITKEIIKDGAKESDNPEINSASSSENNYIRFVDTLNKSEKVELVKNDEEIENNFKRFSAY